MKYYQKRPEFDAIQVSEQLLDRSTSIDDWAYRAYGKIYKRHPVDPVLVLLPPEDGPSYQYPPHMREPKAEIGDYIVRDKDGHIFFVRREAFERQYEVTE